MKAKDIIIDGVIGKGIGEVSASLVRSQLPDNGTDPIRLRIHSEGGDVFEGFAIHDALKEYAGHKVASVASSAFSIASFIPLACDEIEITPNGYMMLHNPYAKVEGDDEEMECNSQLLKQLKANMINAYSMRTGKSVEEIAAILKKETFFNADQCVALGLANRITGEPVSGRVFARLNNLPHGVVSALFGVDSRGKEVTPTRENSKMSEATNVAATVQEIRAAFPKAKAEFVLTCLERSMPMASVAHAAVEEMMKENAELSARCKAMEDEMLALKACDEEMPVEETDEEVAAKAVAKSRGVKPLAVAKGSTSISATARWNEVVEENVKAGMSRVIAARKANQTHGSLREAMLSEVNS